MQLYKGWLGDGSVAVIKCVQIKQRHLPQHLMQNMEAVSKLRHRHLISVLGHCVVSYDEHPNTTSNVFVVLELEHISNGNLRDYLAGKVNRMEKVVICCRCCNCHCESATAV